MSNAEQISQIPYRKELGQTLRSETNHAFRRDLLGLVKNDPEYKRAKDAEKRRKLALREISRPVLTNAEDGSSQASPVIGNPLVDLKPAESELTPQEQTILWANQVLGEYNRLPKQNSREKKVAKNLASQAARRLLQNLEEIDIAGSVWISRETTSEGQRPTNSFYEEVKEEAVKAIERDWKKPTQEISSIHLAQFVKTYANSVLTQDFAHDLLTGYFKGANSRRQRIDAFYNLASAALDLVEDQRSLTEAVRIGVLDTDILPRYPNKVEQSLFYNLPYNEEDRVLQKYLIADAIIPNLASLALEDFEQSMFLNRNIGSSLEYKVKWDKEQRNAAERIGRQKVIEINKAMIRYTESQRDVMDASAFKRINVDWPFNLFYDETEPLMQKYLRLVREKMQIERIKETIQKSVKDNLVSFSIASPNGLIIDVVSPDVLRGKRSELTRYALANRPSEEDMTSLDEPQSSIFSTTFLWAPGKFEDTKIFLFFRKPAGYEQNQHILQSLELIGFPNPTTEGDRDIGLANIELAEEIKRTQLRFLNKRGVRVPVENTPLGEFGYSHIDFQKDGEDPSKTLVKIFVGDVPYSVKLDRYFNFDFEGKKFNAPFIQDALRYAILSYLKPILCEETVKNAKGEEKDLDAEVVSRMGHLMLLPSDRHRSVQAIVNCFRVEGKDLIALDAERREMRRKAGNRVPEDREYTYRRPVIEKEENLPPIIINLPGILRFRNS